MRIQKLSKHRSSHESLSALWIDKQRYCEMRCFVERHRVHAGLNILFQMKHERAMFPCRCISLVQPFNQLLEVSGLFDY